MLNTLKLPDNHGFGSYDRSRAAEIRKQLQDRVNTRLVELMAQDLYVQMKAVQEAVDG